MVQERFEKIIKQGDPEVMQVDYFASSAPCEGDVVIRQNATDMKFLDVYRYSSTYQIPLPSGIGMEAAGVVEAVGPGVTDPNESVPVAYGGGFPAAASWQSK